MELKEQLTVEQMELKIKDLSEPSAIYNNQKAAEKRFENLTSDEYGYLRSRSKTDLFFLAYGVLGFQKLSTKLHGDLCNWMWRTQNEQFREILLPRGHYKSTVVTVSDSVQIILPDVGGNSVWPRNLGGNCRLLIGHETHDSAARFLFQITSNFLGNPVLMGLFPECVPSPRKQRINTYELELPRSEFWAEPTIDTMGVGGKNQGRHYNYIKLDDLIGDKARDSELEMQRAKDWFDNIQSFFSTFAKDKFDLIGTRWGFTDLYAHVHNIYGEQLHKYIRGVEEVNPASGKKETIFPEEFPIEKLEILRKNRKVFSAQYANDPAEGASEFDPSWKRFYYRNSVNRISVFSGESSTSISDRDLDVCFLIDPAMTGLAGFVITGTDSGISPRVFILEAMKQEWKPPELVNLIFQKVSQYRPRVVAIEHVLFSGLFQNWINTEMRVRGISFNLIPVKTGGKAKEARVRGLSNYFSAGRIYFHDSQKELIEEYDHFGATNNYHMLDALAYGPDVWKPALRREVWNNYGEVAKQILDGRDIETGYSSIDYDEDLS